MSKILALTLLIPLTGLRTFAADDHPRAEGFLGFTYLRVNSATDVPAFSANGGSGQIAVNFNKWVGFVGDVGAVHNGNISSFHIDTTLTSFMFGPRVTFRSSRVTPYLQALWGGVYGSTSVAVNAIPVPPSASLPIVLPGGPIVPPNTPVSLRASASETAFAMAYGGGVDIKINKHVSYRVISLDWQMFRLQNLRSQNDNNQHCLRFSTGLNFTFGAQ